MNTDLTDKQKVLAENVNDALLQVAHLGQELADTSGTKSDGTYLVDKETMVELKQAIEVWTTATEAFLSSISKGTAT